MDAFQTDRSDARFAMVVSSGMRILRRPAERDSISKALIRRFKALEQAFIRTKTIDFKPYLEAYHEDGNSKNFGSRSCIWFSISEASQSSENTKDR